MADTDDDDLRELRRELMVAEIANKRADTALKDEQRRWEPLRAMSTAFGAGVAVASVLIAAGVAIGRFWIGG